jgi:hypothetical protein
VRLGLTPSGNGDVGPEGAREICLDTDPRLTPWAGIVPASLRSGWGGGADHVRTFNHRGTEGSKKHFQEKHRF